VCIGSAIRKNGGRVYAFEPVPRNYERLVKAIAHNQLEKVAHASEVALSDTTGSITMHISDQEHGEGSGNAIMSHGDVASHVKGFMEAVAQMIPLDDWVKDKDVTQCHFIKVDIEGAELLFINGGIEFIKKHRPVIFGEFNAYWIKQFGYTLKEVRDVFEPLNYDFYKQNHSHDFIKFQDSDEVLTDIYLVPSEVSAEKKKLLGIVG
jgi:FkbM family methyltransferase